LLVVAIWLGSADSSAFAARSLISLLAVAGLLVWTLFRPLRAAAQSRALSTSAPEPDIESSPQDGRAPLFQGTEILLTGVHGWLGFFCFAQLFIQPLFVAWPLVAAFRASETLADRLRELPLVGSVALLTIYGVVVGIALARRTSGAVWHAKFYLRCCAVAMLALIPWAFVTLDSVNAGALSLRFFESVISAIVWLAYFSRSTRVALTYGEATLTAGPTHTQTLAAAVGICALIGSPAIAMRAIWPSISQTWIVYGPMAGGFRVMLPSEPKVTTLASNAIVITRALVETPSDAATFEISYFDLPSGRKVNADALLNAMGEAVVRNTRMRLHDSRAISIDQFSGREYLGDAGLLRIRGRLFLVGRRVYELQAVTRTYATGRQLEAADRFLTSFALLPR